jgi:AraC family transcriptional regulator of adaptative response / DNA-3-methyladenine glycosylase II
VSGGIVSKKRADLLSSAAEGRVTERLRYRPPYDWGAMLAHLEARAIEGVEQVEDGVYRRTVAVGARLGWVEVGHEPARTSLKVTVGFPGEGSLQGVLTRVRRVFDVDADVGAIAAHLSRDSSLAPLLALRPGLRVPGGWDGFELAMRAVLGQQITVGAARRLASRLVALCGPVVSEAARLSATLSHAFPLPEQVAAADLAALGMPRARRASLKALAEATLANPDLFRAGGSLEEAIARLRAIRGVGDWTAHYIALRALRDTDAFPASDIGLLRGAAVGGVRPTSAELLRRAEPWRPWRAYAAQHLWASDALTVAPVERKAAP